MTIATPRDLLHIIESLAGPTPRSDRLAVKYPNRQHWIGWLREYDGPGFYGRSIRKRSAGFVYSHLNCAPMIVWLAEAGGVGDLLVTTAISAFLPLPNPSSQAGAARRVLPWPLVERHLETGSGVTREATP